MKHVSTTALTEEVVSLCTWYGITDQAFIETLVESSLPIDEKERLLEHASLLVDSSRDVVPCWLLLEVYDSAKDEVHLEKIFALARSAKGCGKSSIRALQYAMEHCSYIEA